MSNQYKKQKEEVQAEQSNLSYKEVKNLMESTNEFVLELDNLKPQQHNWTDRGLKWTCEFAGHNYHEAYKIRRR